MMKVRGWVTDQTDEYCVYRVQFDGIEGTLACEWIAGDFDAEGWACTGTGHDTQGHYILMFSKRFLNISELEDEEVLDRYEIEDEDTTNEWLLEPLS
jgi:hypothetical protein